MKGKGKDFGARKKHRNGWLVGIVLLVILVFAFVSFVPTELRLTFSVLEKLVSFTGGQDWDIFDKSSRLIQSSRSSEKTLLFQLIPPYSSTKMSDVGWVRVHEWFRLTDSIGGDWGGLNTQAIVFTRDLDAQVLINGASYANIGFIPWNQPTSWINYIQGWSHQSDVVFATGDLPGTERSAVIYLVFDSSKRPSDCNTNPSACVNLSSEVAKGKDFTIELKITETWDDYTVEPYFLGKTCAIKVGHMVNTCINPLEHRTVDLKWGVNLLDLGHYTTIKGTPTFVVTQSSTAMETATIHVTRTVESHTTKLIVVEEHVSTTITATETLTANTPDFCKAYPDFFLCKLGLPDWLDWLWESTWGIPNWLFVVAGVLVVLWILVKLFAPKVQVGVGYRRY